MIGLNIRDLISGLYPDLGEIYNSSQYKLSKQIIGRKLELNLTQLQMSYLMKMSFDKYLEMEKGSTEIPVSEYEIALESLSNISDEELNAYSYLSEGPVQYPNFVFKISDIEDFDFKFNIEIKDLKSIDIRYGESLSAFETKESELKKILKSHVDEEELVPVKESRSEHKVSIINSKKINYTQLNFETIKVIKDNATKNVLLESA